MQGSQLEALLLINWKILIQNVSGIWVLRQTNPGANCDE